MNDTPKKNPLESTQALNVPAAALRALAYKDQLHLLKEPTQNRLDAAIDTILDHYKRQAREKASARMGFSVPPRESSYLIVDRGELPILEQPNINAATLGILGIAREGEYLPILQNVELSYFLGNPLSNRPANPSKWCKVRTNSGTAGWIIAEPNGIGEKRSVKLVVFTPPTSAVSQDTGSTAAIIIVSALGFLLYLLLRSMKATDTSGYSGSPSALTNSDADLDSESATSASLDDADGATEERGNGADAEPGDRYRPNSALGDITFSVRVVDKDGEAIENADVYVHVHGPTQSETEKTDEDGWAHFTIVTLLSGLMEGGVTVSIEVNGQEQANNLFVEDGKTFSYTID